MSYTIRDYKEGDIPRQLEVMKEVTRELYPVIPYNVDDHTIELYQRIYSRSGWHPNPLKFLLDENKKIVGYGGYGSLFNDLRLFYPYILGEHRTQELQQRIFDAEMDAVKKYSEKYESFRIFSRSDYKLTHHNAFWDTQTFQERKVAFHAKVDTEKLKKGIPKRFQTEYFSDECHTEVIEFTKKCSLLGKPYLTKKIIEERISSGNIIPKTHVIIREDEEIQAFVGVRVGRRPGAEESVAVLNLDYIEATNIDAELRQSLMLALYPIFKENIVKKFRFEILEDSLSIPEFKKLGFEMDETDGGIFFFYE